MLGWLNEKKIRHILEIPSGRRVVLVILLGYSDQPVREKKRKLLSEIISREKY